MTGSEPVLKPQQSTGKPADMTIGVLGHVDHGKTSLVRALTGIETDRLKEEKQRGLSIVPGFAWLESGRGGIDFIDLPGHEDFIRMMISGSTGIDYVLLVVAANEGIKPQTEEHVNIAGFLGAPAGLVVITKTDLVSAPALEQLESDVHDFLQGTFLEDAPIMQTGINDAHSIDSLRAALEQQLLDPVERKDFGQCYLPLDRVFTMTGFGTVATGTLRNGRLSNGQEVEILPRARRARIRRLQVHNQDKETAWPGQRVAVNLRNVDRGMIARGDVLAAPGYLRPTRFLDAELRLIPRLERPPKYAEMIRLLFGTCEVPAVARVLGAGQPTPGAACIVQFTCMRDVVVPVGERFIVRTLSPGETIGGGRILDNAPVKHRRYDRGAVARLLALASENPAEIIRAKLHSAGSRGISAAQLLAVAGISEDELEHLLAGSPSEIVFIPPQRVMAKPAFDSLCAQALKEIDRFHAENPGRTGQPSSELQSRMSGAADDTVFRFLIDHLEERDVIRKDRNIVRRREFNPLQSLNPEEQALTREIIGSFMSAGLKPPELDDVLQGAPERQRLYHLLTQAGELVPVHSTDINRKIVFHRCAIEGMVCRLEQAYPDARAFGVAEVRNLLDISRKFAIPLLEYLDGMRVTIRVGDKRRLYKGPKPVASPRSGRKKQRETGS